MVVVVSKCTHGRSRVDDSGRLALVGVRQMEKKFYWTDHQLFGKRKRKKEKRKDHPID